MLFLNFALLFSCVASETSWGTLRGLCRQSVMQSLASCVSARECKEGHSICNLEENIWNASTCVYTECGTGSVSMINLFLYHQVWVNKKPSAHHGCYPTTHHRGKTVQTFRKDSSVTTFNLWKIFCHFTLFSILWWQWWNVLHMCDWSAFMNFHTFLWPLPGIMQKYSILIITFSQIWWPPCVSKYWMNGLQSSF